MVVTALGIKRERKALGYGIDEVKGEALTKAKETNLINSMAGRVPGLVVSQTAGGPSGSTRVILRGSTEMTGNNQPLYVVDGVPLDNTNFGSAGTNGGFDLGDGISSINADDVENMSVLKGPAASALYGSRASHGVILITTKRANKDKISVEYNGTLTFDTQLAKWDEVRRRGTPFPHCPRQYVQLLPHGYHRHQLRHHRCEQRKNRNSLYLYGYAQ